MPTNYVITGLRTLTRELLLKKVTMRSRGYFVSSSKDIRKLAMSQG
jgi:hypothetical protein